jgi:hypothetical protein
MPLWCGPSLTVCAATSGQTAMQRALAGQRRVAMDAIGNAMAVWEQAGKNTGGDIWASRFTPSTGWGTATLLESGADKAGKPQVAIDATGNAMAVWEQIHNGHNSIWATHYVLGSGWGRAELIETSDTRDAANPQIALHASGNAVVVWEQFDGLRSSIVANRYTLGSGWGVPELIEKSQLWASSCAPGGHRHQRQRAGGIGGMAAG